VLILTPFRNTAHAIVREMLEMLPAAYRGEVANLKRFEDEFGEEDEKDFQDKPDDFKEVFEGNTDDCFRMGIGFMRKTTKLFAPFYKADVIIASPLGLKLIVGDEG